ncbi:SPFH domain-containing protein [Desulfovibrionales bacterium]
MGTDNIFFLELIEWFDESGQEVAHRFPEKGSGEIKFGAQMVVRESQAGVFFYNGKAVHVFGPGRHTLKTGNIPILNKIMGLPWALNSPLRAEAYLINTKVFANLKWGTREPVAFKDAELGLIRLRAYGMFNIQVTQPLLFINSLVGTTASFSVSDLTDYLGKVIVSRFNDYLGENMDTLLNLPSQYEEWSAGLHERLHKDFLRFGLSLNQLYINSITPPPEVQQAIDDKTKLNMFTDMHKYMQLKAAAAMERAAQNTGTVGDAMGMGVGFMMPALMAQTMQLAQNTAGQAIQAPSLRCPECQQSIGEQDRFCAACGHQLLVFAQCAACGKNIGPGAKFCPQCGAPVAPAKKTIHCPGCHQENLASAVFCIHCGERIPR